MASTLVTPCTTLDVPLRAGHAFTQQDSASTYSAIVNETLARRLFEGGDPVGSRIWIAQAAYEIVGVVADYSNHPFQFEDFNPKIFLQQDQAVSQQQLAGQASFDKARAACLEARGYTTQ